MYERGAFPPETFLFAERRAALPHEILQGRIVQLGERLPYTQEVTGSIPVPPTGVVVKLVYNAGLSRRRPRVRIPSTPPVGKGPL